MKLASCFLDSALTGQNGEKFPNESKRERDQPCPVFDTLGKESKESL